MPSKNLDQGIQAIQQQNFDQGKRLIRIAMRNDSLNQQEQVQAMVWLAEAESTPSDKVALYQQALQIDPSNQDVINRLTYWTQQAQQQNLNSSQTTPQVPSQQGFTPPQGNQPISPTQQGFNQGLTPSQGMSPVNPNSQGFNQQPNWQNPNQPNPQGFNQGLTPSQGMSPVNPNQQGFNQQPNWQNPNQPNPQGFNQGLTPSQGMPPVNPNQQGFNQQPNWQNPNQPNPQGFNQGLTPSQGMPSVNPNQQGFTQGMTPSQGMPPQQTGAFITQAAGYGQQPPIQLEQVQRSVGIPNGPNGPGTGFFVTREGLVATTRHVVSGERQITVELLDRRKIQGTVVRAFPEFDLVLIETNVRLTHLLVVSESPIIPDDTQIVGVTHSGDGIRSAKRHSINEVDQHWFPTLINHLKDAGGNPIFDNKNMLVGMLTNNASRSNGYMYGLHIHRIYQCVDQYIHEKSQLAGQQTLYCHACGIISRAPSFGGYFCENCGNTHPYALELQRFPQPNLAHLYGESSPRPCPSCQSQVGFYKRDCLRCGYQL